MSQAEPIHREEHRKVLHSGKAWLKNSRNKRSSFFCYVSVTKKSFYNTNSSSLLSLFEAMFKLAQFTANNASDSSGTWLRWCSHKLIMQQILSLSPGAEIWKQTKMPVKIVLTSNQRLVCWTNILIGSSFRCDQSPLSQIGFWSHFLVLLKSDLDYMSHLMQWISALWKM